MWVFLDPNLKLHEHKLFKSQSSPIEWMVDGGFSEWIQTPALDPCFYHITRAYNRLLYNLAIIIQVCFHSLSWCYSTSTSAEGSSTTSAPQTSEFTMMMVMMMMMPRMRRSYDSRTMGALLYTIVAVQLVCHLPRTGLNIYEIYMVSLEQWRGLEKLFMTRIQLYMYMM